ncbi:hypothetical protein [Aquamicrobium sp. LC103]|uniref:N-acyl amino acid synthase FeeM domain-containing protein n=1 Tax=Aquamicrobium sp. LC103 TaxID=1120658 RepID=UPI001FEE5BE6|nr:hypothetical protein [Aquamicrobium sp. LC103]
MIGLSGAARGRSREEAGQRSGFVNNIFSILERTEYRRTDSGEDLEDIYKLRYKSYRTHGIVPEIGAGSIYDDLDEVDNVYRFGVYIDQHLVSTLRIHVLDRSNRPGPSTQAFGDLVHPMIDAGHTLIDPSRFAADPEWSRAYPQIPYITLRLAGMACFFFDAPYCLSTVRDDHAAFYKRIYFSEKIGEARPYPGVYSKVELYRADVSAIRERSFQRFPFFWSSKVEQRLMFERPREGELAPLTILPTAKYMNAAA